MVPIASLVPEEINALFSLERSFIGEQIFRWIHKDVFDFQKMSDLPKELRNSLQRQAAVLSSRITDEIRDKDGTLKARIELRDKRSADAVLLIDGKGRRTACLSTQVGCGMGCRFCKTAQMGLIRNLTDYEIVEQFLLLRSAYGEISNIVFMGMGEPLLNLDNLRKAVVVFNHPKGSGMSMRRMTVSTCGLVSGIGDLTANGPFIRLAFSLITADPSLRKVMVPSARKNSLREIRQSLLEYQRKTKKRITLEIVLLDGVNDRKRDVEALVDFVYPLDVVVNIIPWNMAEGLNFRMPAPDKVKRFQKKLEERGISVTQRYRRGRGVNAACGQLYIPFH